MALQAGDGGRTFVLPTLSASEAALCDSGVVLAANSLLEVCAHLSGQGDLMQAVTVDAENTPIFPDLKEVRGQSQAKRALEIAAAGNHSLLMIGPPGSGKSMLAARLPGLMPPLDRVAARSSAAVLSLIGQFHPERFAQRPYRSPHHTASAVALVGGGNPPRPGEISLAHMGVLFLDELTEFDRKVLETLREPLESGRIHIARAARQMGNRGKLSGPFLDRIDLLIEVPALPAEALSGQADGESSAIVRARVEQAITIQTARQKKPNARLTPAEVEACCTPDEAGGTLLKQAMSRLDLSARAWHRILKVARTIADLAGSNDIRAPHVAEAIQYRRLAGG
jgi:magnesium chelatase family protein